MKSSKSIPVSVVALLCTVMAMLLFSVETDASTTKETKDSPLFASELNASVASMNRFAEGGGEEMPFTMNADFPFCVVRETMDADSEACKLETVPKIFSTFDGFSGILTVPCLTIPGTEPFFGVLELYNWKEMKYKFRIESYASSPLDSEFCATVDPETLLVTLPFVKTGGATYYVELALVDPEALIFEAVVFNQRPNIPDYEDTMNPMDDRCEFTETVDPMDIACENIIPETMNPLECDDFAETMNPMERDCEDDIQETMNPMNRNCQFKPTMNPMNIACGDQITVTMDPMDRDCNIAETMNPMNKDCGDDIGPTTNPMDSYCELAETMDPMNFLCVLTQTMNPMDKNCSDDFEPTMNPMDFHCVDAPKETMAGTDPGCEPPETMAVTDPGCEPPETMAGRDSGCEPPETMAVTDPGCEPPETMAGTDSGCEPPETMAVTDPNCEPKETMAVTDPNCEPKETMAVTDPNCQSPETMDTMDPQCM